MPLYFLPIFLVILRIHCLDRKVTNFSYIIRVSYVIKHFFAKIHLQR